MLQWQLQTTCVCCVCTYIYGTCTLPRLYSSVHYICMYLVLRMVPHMVVIQCLDSFLFRLCSVTSCHVSCRWCCASYQLWSTGSQLYMHPVCHSDGLFVSNRCATPSALPTHACTPVVLFVFLSYGMCSLYCQLHPLLTYMDRFDVVLTLVSLVYHCMWCRRMLHSLDTYWFTDQLLCYSGCRWYCASCHF